MTGDEDQDHGTAELERTWLQMLVFLTVAWLLIGAVGAGLTLAVAFTPWAAAWFIPCVILAVTGVMQSYRVARAEKHE